MPGTGTQVRPGELPNPTMRRDRCQSYLSFTAMLTSSARRDAMTTLLNGLNQCRHYRQRSCLIIVVLIQSCKLRRCPEHGYSLGAVPLIDDRLLTVSEVADQLRISQNTVRNWLPAGRLNGRRIGGTKAGWRISASEIPRFLSGSQSPERKDRSDRDTAPG